MNQRTEPVEIVITGGPGAGKSTSMSRLTERLSEWGYRVFVVPEAASMIITGGVSDIVRIAQEEPRLFNSVQRHLLRTQRSLRKRFRALAGEFDEPTVILYDRGEMDNQAYMGPDHFRALLAEEGLSLVDARDSYAAVIHLQSAACGAEAHYTLANNAARSESAELARQMDAATLGAWVGHPHLRVVPALEDFEQKIHRVAAEVARVLGVPVPLEIERKFLLAAAPDFSRAPLSGAVVSEIEQVYLRSDDEDVTLRVRRRDSGNGISHTRTVKRRIGDGVSEENERRISPSAYLYALEDADPAAEVVRKRRWVLPWQGHYLEIDHLTAPCELWLLEIELTEEGQEVSLPDFLSIAREVTGEPDYSMAGIARGRRGARA